MQRAAPLGRDDATPKGGATVVVLGTGGTIAGMAASAADNVGYTAARTGVAQLVAGLAGAPAVLVVEQVAQIDSKDMDFAVWQRLAERVGHHLARPEVAGIVITHGTDTLEETAYFLHRVFAPLKPVVLTGAMRPATSLQADGPQNLQDAITLAAGSEASGVLVVMAGTVHAGAEVRKIHPYRLDAFSSGESGALARIEEGRVRLLRRWPVGPALGTDILAADTSRWPAVEIVTSCSGARGSVVQALCAAGVRGIVVAATGSGTV
ncbi:MAG TPA: asparaginase, partial [Caldimonas sp.]